ncbi:MAG: DNA gyrase subunit A [Candidatus Bipolaricaulota bacterium]|nr:DNA gyrase subunit A [Candidatus Bipolaricaulota bacterium]MDW8126937.1 DNA gyrase subunit A [Candidatus Bipolaricaulota bacterium]
MPERIEMAFIEEEMEQSYIDYAISVIRGRAIPDVRDGLKPVQRRILYGMRELGLAPNRPHRKSARIVGEVLGKYHPHGDMAVYEAMVGLAQPFTTRYPLIDGQGNFGSVDGDEPAAMRYTEARLSPIAMEFLEELDEDTVDFLPNFDGSLQEPEVLPVRFPHLLANGAWGISVGMTTQIPPHNLRELIQATLYILDHPQASVDELISLIPGPDFPTGGIIVGQEGIREAYTTGEGRFVLRGRAFVEEDKIVITEIPYQVRKSALLETIAEKVKEGELEGVSDLRDESDREGLRVVVELKRGADPERVLAQLYKLTPLERTFSCHFLVIDQGMPRVLSLPQILRAFLEFRRATVRRRTEYRLRQARDRAHILEGFQKALARLSEVIEIIRGAAEPEQAEALLAAEIGLTQKQAEAVLRMRLSQLTRLERQKIDEELVGLRQKIQEYEGILADPRKLDDVIRAELAAVADRYGDARRTAIVERDDFSFVLTDAPALDVMVCVTNKGYVNITERQAFRAQGRGGKGVIGIRPKEGDFLRQILPANTREDLLVFTDRGRVFKVPLARLEVSDRDSPGKNLRQFLDMSPDEEVRAVCPVADYSQGYALLATRMGIVNRNALSDYANARASGIIAHDAEEGDRLVDVTITQGGGEVVLATAQGQIIRFPEEEIRVTRRPSKGVIGMRLEPEDHVVTMVWLPPGVAAKKLLLVTSQGYGKRVALEDIPVQGRGGKGVIGIKLDGEELVAAVLVSDTDEVALSTAAGKVIRFEVAQVSTFSRYARGVRLIQVDPEDRVVSAVAV